MTGTPTPEPLFVDPAVEYHAHRNLTGLDNAGLQRAIRGAASYAFGSAHDAGRTPVQLEVIVRVAP